MLRFRLATMRTRESSASFSKWLRLLVTVVVALRSHKEVSAVVQLYRELHHDLYKVAVYRGTKDVYVGGNNVLFRLDQDLNVLQTVTLNSTCARQHPCDKVVTVLEVDYTLRKLLVCWTESRGQCALYDLETLVMAPLQHRAMQGYPADIVSPPFARPRSKPIVIQVDQSTSSSSPGRSSWLAASPDISKEHRPNPQDPNSHAIFSIGDISAITNMKDNYLISNSSFLTKNDLSFYYDVLDGLCVEPGCFFLTLQNNNTNGGNYFSRMSRVCSGSLFPYLELPLFEELPPISSYRSVALALGELNAEKYLIVVSVKADPAKTLDDDSAGFRLDYTSLTKLEDRLLKIYSEHCTKHSSQPPGWWYKGHFGNCTERPFGGKLCSSGPYTDKQTAKVVIEGNVHANLEELYNTTTVTAAKGLGRILSAFTHTGKRAEFFTIFVITSSGVIYKVYAESDFKGGLTARSLPATFLDTGHYCRDFALSDDCYYLLAGSKVLRQPLDYCMAIYDCHECKKVAGCTWSIIRTICRLQTSQSQDEISDELCPVAVKLVTPLSGPVEGRTLLTFHGTDFRFSGMNLSMCQHDHEIVPYNQSMFEYLVPPSTNGTDENCTLTVVYRDDVVFSSVFTYKNPIVTWFAPQRVLSSDRGSIEFRGHDLDVGLNASVVFVSDKTNFTCTVIKRYASNIRCMFDELPRVPMIVNATIDNASYLTMDSGILSPAEDCDCYDVIISIDAAVRNVSEVGRLCRCPDPTVTSIEPQLVYETGLTEFEVRGRNLDLAIVYLLFTMKGTTNASPICSVCSGIADGSCLRCSLSLNMTSAAVDGEAGEVTLRMEGRQSRAPVNHSLTLHSPVRVRVMQEPVVQIYTTSVLLDPSVCRQVDVGLTLLSFNITAVVPTASVSVAVEDGLRRLTCARCQQIESPLSTTAAASPRANTKSTTTLTTRRSTTRPATTTKTPPRLTSTAKSSTGTRTPTTDMWTTTTRRSTSRPAATTSTRRPLTIFTTSTAITTKPTSTTGRSSLKTSSAVTGSTLTSGRPAPATTQSGTAGPRTFHCHLSLHLVIAQHLDGNNLAANACQFKVNSTHKLDLWVELGSHHCFKVGCLAVSNSSAAAGAESASGDTWWHKQQVLIGPGAGVGVLLATVALVCYARRKRQRFLQRRRKHLDMKQSASSSGGLLHPSTSEGSPESEFISVEHMLIRSGDHRRLQEVRDSGLLIPRQRLNIGKVIGHGNFGCVHEGDLRVNEGSDNDLRPVAIKTLLDAGSQSVDLQGFVNEALLMKNFHHDHVLGLLGLADGDLGPLVVLPFMERGDLLSFVKNKETLLSVGDVLRFSTDIASGMDYLASNKFVHRDLAARNCMLDSQLRAKVADFGLCRDVYEKGYYRSDNKKKLPIRWMAVESIESGAYTSKSDVWSFGVVIWEMTTRGTTPYPGVEGWDILRYLTAGRRLDQPNLCPDSLYGLMGKCWHQEPMLRPTFHELLQDLEAQRETLRDPCTASDTLCVSSPITFPDCRHFRDDAALVARVKAAALMNYSLARVIGEFDIGISGSADDTSSSHAPKYLELINSDLPPSSESQTLPEDRTIYYKKQPDGLLRSENQEKLAEQAISGISGSADDTYSTHAPKYLELINSDLPPSSERQTLPEDRTIYSKMQPDGLLRSDNQEKLAEQAHASVEVRHPMKDNTAKAGVDEGYFLLEKRAGVCSVVSSGKELAPKPNSEGADLIDSQTTEQSSLLSQNYEESLKEDAAADKLVKKCTHSSAPLGGKTISFQGDDSRSPRKKRPFVATKPGVHLHDAVKTKHRSQFVDESTRLLLVHETNTIVQTPVDNEARNYSTQEQQPSRKGSPGIAMRNSSTATFSEIPLSDLMSQSSYSGKPEQSDQTVKSDGYFMLEGSSTTKL